MTDAGVAPAVPHLEVLLGIVAGWLLVGAAGLFALHRLRLVSRVLFPVGGALGLALAVIAAGGLFAPEQSVVLPIGLPDLPFHMRLDSLSAFFLVVLGAVSAGVSAFAAGYFRKGEGTPPGLLCMQYHLFLASMALVMLADDAYAFMVAWETMALSSYFLVTANHRIPEIRRRRLPLPPRRTRRRDHDPAVLRRAAGRHGRLHLRQHARAARCRRSGPRRRFVLALFGFGAKAGIAAAARLAARGPPRGALPGVGVDERRDAQDRDLRPAARHLRPARSSSSGGGASSLLALGSLTALFGVVFAAVQIDMKRLLAYSSIENIGSCSPAWAWRSCSPPSTCRPWRRSRSLPALYHVADPRHASRACCSWGPVPCCMPPASATRPARRPHPLHALGRVAHADRRAGHAPDCRRSTDSCRNGCCCRASCSPRACPDPFLNMLVPVAAAVVALVAALWRGT